MDAINNLLIQLNAFIGNKSVWFPYVLLGTGIFFSLYLKFPQIRFFRHALRIVTGRYEKDTFEGDTTHFQSLSTALSGTIGTGNIGGVGLALWIGGPAALFWLWITAFFGMTLKFVECTLSHKYRKLSGTITYHPSNDFKSSFKFGYDLNEGAWTKLSGSLNFRVSPNLRAEYSGALSISDMKIINNKVILIYEIPCKREISLSYDQYKKEFWFTYNILALPSPLFSTGGER